MRNAPLLLLTLPFLAIVAAFQLAPMIWVVINSFMVGGEFSLGNYQNILGSDYYRQSMWNSIGLAIYSSSVCLIIATAFSYALNQSPRAAGPLVSIINMLNNFSGVPLAFAFVIILGFNGTITMLLINWGIIESFDLYSLTGLMLVYIYFQIPLAILLLYPAFDALKVEWQEASALLGANTFTYWQSIGLPILIRPLITTFVILFADAVGSYATAYALTNGAYNLLTLQITSLVAGELFPEPELAAALSVMLICCIIIVAGVGQLAVKRANYAS